MGRSSVPYDVQLDVAKKFWKYLKQSEPKPDTRMALRDLYLESCRPLLVNPAEQRVNFSTVFHCMKSAGFLKASGENRDKIVYQKLKPTQEFEVQEQRISRTDINEASASSKNPSKAEPLHQTSIEKTPSKVNEQERQKDGEDFGDLTELRKKLDTQRHHLVKDKGKVTITPSSNQDGVIDLGTIDSSPSISFQLHIRNEIERKLIFGCAVLKSVTNCDVDTTSCNVTVGLVGDELDGFEHIAVPVEICGHKPGLLQVPLAFWFMSGKGQPFYIVKFIKAEITDNQGLLEGFGNLAELRKKLLTNRHQVVRDKGKIVTSPASNKDGVIDLGVIENSQSRSFQLYITNQSDGKLGFRYAVLESVSDCNVDTTSYEVTVEPVEEELDGIECITIPVEISGNKPGVFYVPLVFWFKSGKGQPFYIVKFIKAEISANLVKEPPPVSDEGQSFGDLAELRKKLVTNRHHLAKDKGDIIIFPASNTDGVIDMGCIDVSESKSFQLHIRNKSERKLLFGYVVLGSGSDFHVDSTNNGIIDEKMGNELGGYECVPVGVEIIANNPGIFHVTLAFWFKCGKGKPFHIVKFIKAEVTDNLVNDLQPTSPYVRPKAISRNEPASELIRGEPPPFEETLSLVKLEAYPIPRMLKEKASERCLDSYLTKVFRGDLTAQNHRDRFSKLLHSEEIQMEKDIRRYDMEKVKLRSVSKQYLALAVPGLAENRPSLVCGDRLFVRKLKRDGKGEKKMYEGFVHRVELNEVHLKFCSTFHKSFVNNMLFNVQFTFSRTPLKLMHRALAMARAFISQLPYNGDPPDSKHSVNKIKRLRYYDPNVASNEEQKQAVENILLGTSRPYPYLVFGPPGSGKTVTMVEAIKQVLKNFPESKVLACAPSNSAADLILERVSKHNAVPNAQMIRLNAYGRNESSVHPSILKFCKKNKNGFFCFPPEEEIKRKYRLVVTTLISAGRLVSMKIGNSHFTHVFIDEAGHGMEPECLVPIAGLHKTGGQLVLAGDPKQLGPVLRSPEAIKFGLSVSLLERLMGPQFPSFNRQPGNASSAFGTYNEKLVTKLLNNYRSHPAIIKLPNEMFYDNELRPCADQLLRESLCQWNGLRKKGFPVLFEGVCGKDQREEKSPSFFNPQEVSVVLRYVKDLKDARGISVKMEEIGIISPYHRQVQKIRQSLDKKLHIRDIKVGSVEEFQGQERKVIIISTVRSTEKLLHLDAIYKLGFLRNPKRFNVATTRAKALLVVIGNPHVLCKDEYWRRFIQYCLNNGSYKGCVFQMPRVDDENLAAQLANLGLNDDEAFYADVENTTSTDYEDQEWKLGEH